MTTTIPTQIDYKDVAPSATPKYRFLRIPLNNLTGSTFQVGPTTSQLMEFKLPNTVYNLAQSYVSYQLSIPTSGATFANWVHDDCLDVATTAYFGSAAGPDLCNLQYVNRYTKIVRKMKTSLQDFLSKDISSQLHTCNSAATANLVAASGASATTNYTEPQYIRSAALDTAVTATRKFNLNGIKDTIFSVDKDLYIPSEMYVRFTCGVGNQIAFASTNIADPTAGAAAIAVPITVQQTYLWLAVEQNQLIIDSVMNKVLTTGLKMNVPYTTAWRTSSTGTIANIQIPINQQYGRKLKRMLHTVWNATESSNTALDCANRDGAKKITLYNTFMDNKQMQDFQLSTAASDTTGLYEDDWRENRKYCKGSVIQNRAMYNLNWFHCDSWVEPSKNYFDDDSNEDDGLPMNTPRLWQIQATTANANLTHYNFGTFIRQVVIDRSGANFV